MVSSGQFGHLMVWQVQFFLDTMEFSSMSMQPLVREGSLIDIRCERINSRNNPWWFNSEGQKIHWRWVPGTRLRKPWSDLSIVTRIGSNPSRAWMRQERDNGSLSWHSPFTIEPEQNSTFELPGPGRAAGRGLQCLSSVLGVRG